MLSKKKRLTRALFTPLQSSRLQSHSLHFGLKTAPAEAVRISVSVTKKVAKSAVARNRIRRLVYAELQHIFSSLQPALYLVIVKSGAEKLKGKELGNELKSLVVSRQPFRLDES